MSRMRKFSFEITNHKTIKINTYYFNYPFWELIRSPLRSVTHSRLYLTSFLLSVTIKDPEREQKGRYRTTVTSLNN